jgi:ribosomal protein S18 acetylase RimI-like enzyme
MFTTNLKQKIELPEVPEIGGLIFRQFNGDDDYQYMADIINACNAVDQLDRHATAEGIAGSYKHLVNSNPFKDVLIAEMFNKPIAYSRTGWHDEGDVDRIYEHFGFVMPDWRRKGIGRCMFRYNQNYLKGIAAHHPMDKHRWFESFATDTETPTIKLLEGEGYKTVRHFFIMIRPTLDDIPDLPLPTGLEVRPVEPGHYQAINDASREAFRDHWGFSEDLQPTVAEWLDDPNFDPSLWRVAWDGDQVAGMVLSYVNRAENQSYNRKRGYTENICVRRPWRNRGLAKSLIVRSLAAVKERGMQEAALGVDTQNLSGALQLYKSVGFRSTKRISVYRLPF